MASRAASMLGGLHEESAEQQQAVHSDGHYSELAFSPKNRKLRSLLQNHVCLILGTYGSQSKISKAPSWETQDPEQFEITRPQKAGLPRLV